MRKDEEGNPCPGTLGEYRDFCAAFSPHKEECEAVAFLDKMIAEHPKGRDEEVVAPDSQMRWVLMPRLLKRAEGSS